MWSILRNSQAGSLRHDFAAAWQAHAATWHASTPRVCYLLVERLFSVASIAGIMDRRTWVKNSAFQSGGRTIASARRTGSSARSPDYRYRQLAFECLESRQLLSGGPANVEVEFTPLPTPMATVLWDNNATGNTGYEVDRSTSGGSTWITLSNTLPANATSFIDTTVTNGQAYEYRVEAV